MRSTSPTVAVRRPDDDQLSARSRAARPVGAAVPPTAHLVCVQDSHVATGAGELAVAANALIGLTSRDQPGPAGPAGRRARPGRWRLKR